MGNDRSGQADDRTIDLLGNVVDSDGIPEDELLDGEWILAEDDSEGHQATSDDATADDATSDDVTFDDATFDSEAETVPAPDSPDDDTLITDPTGDTDTVALTEPTDADTVVLLQAEHTEPEQTWGEESTDVATTLEVDASTSHIHDIAPDQLDSDQSHHDDDHETVSFIAAAEPDDNDDEVHLFTSPADDAVDEEVAEVDEDTPHDSLFHVQPGANADSGPLAEFEHLTEDGDFDTSAEVTEDAAHSTDSHTHEVQDPTDAATPSSRPEADHTEWTEHSESRPADFDDDTDPEHTSGEDFLSPDGPEPEDCDHEAHLNETNVVPLRLARSADRGYGDQAETTDDAELTADTEAVDELDNDVPDAAADFDDETVDSEHTAEETTEAAAVESTIDSFENTDDLRQSTDLDRDVELTAEDTEETTARHREIELGQGWLAFGRGISQTWSALLVLLVGFATLGAILALVPSPESSGGAQTLPKSAYAEQYKAKIKELGFESAPTVLAVITRQDGTTLKAADQETSQEVVRVANLVDRGDVEQPITPAVVSDDKKAALVRIPFANDLTNEQIGKSMDDLIERTGNVNEDVRVEFAGGPAITRDIGQVFKGADVKLLLSTAAIVAILLLLTYRSPILWIFPLFVVLFVDQAASRLAGQLANRFDLVLDGSVLGITQVLVLGAGTNYALLLTSRYREELQRRPDRKMALTRAIAGAGPAIVASNITVVLALLMLLFAIVPASRTLGLVAGIMLLFTMIFVILLLPAVYAILPRFVFWPFIPKPPAGLASAHKNTPRTRRNGWERIAAWVCSRPLRVLAVSLAILGVLAAGLAGSKIGLKPTEQFTNKPASVKATETLGKHFGQGASGNIEALVHTKVADDLVEQLSQDSRIVGIRQVPMDGPDGTWTKLLVTADAEPGTPESLEAAGFVRKRLVSWSTPPVYVGGQEIAEMQAREFAQQDRSKIVGLILLVVFLVLIWLLKSLVAPVLLLLATSLSAFAAVGAGVWVSLNVLGYPAIDTGVFLLAFLFLIALGIDYTIFLMDRAKQEASRMSTRNAVVQAVGATGGVITSAGVVLAAVFVVLGVLPLVVLAQLGATVCIGILLDTFLVRTLVVPALCAFVGEGIWWPGRRTPAAR